MGHLLRRLRAEAGERATFFRIAREIVADLAAKPAAADEFERAQNPVVSGIERRLKTNAYWLTKWRIGRASPKLIELGPAASSPIIKA
jgi:hypothetical protein